MIHNSWISGLRWNPCGKGVFLRLHIYRQSSGMDQRAANFPQISSSECGISSTLMNPCRSASVLRCFKRALNIGTRTILKVLGHSKSRWQISALPARFQGQDPTNGPRRRRLTRLFQHQKPPHQRQTLLRQYNARHSYANTNIAFHDACTKHPNIATSHTNPRSFGGRMWSGQLSGPRGNRDAGRSRMVRSSTAEFLIVTRPPGPHSQRIGYVQSELRIVEYDNLKLYGSCKD